MELEGARLETVEQLGTLDLLSCVRGQDGRWVAVD
jgi:hypothetical protein